MSALKCQASEAAMSRRGGISLDVILILLGYAVGTVVFAYQTFVPQSEADRALEASLREFTMFKEHVDKRFDRLEQKLDER